ncbi:sulfite exporter TauE/SafE family protein [Pelagovum pacificum]|uniref:Probable membrane transporter protein n=1 Tax=Pelagovum pacificum TaxID=2588711 RepID=A0A5C5GEH1_9RHOB|nr:sulfite exporter TauE/SafE family protein [Pelagovum pacificum]QQA44446.1 sulfite exporter TauE/SafE family protein [Pelagovum pacificum]TNY32437.1 sulfite exporter TauE/SafE family protein [Pelagovum pacificum]
MEPYLLGLAALVAGTVRGFSGFGTAMIYLPVAGRFLDPFEAITTLMLMDLVGPLPGIPAALKHAHRADLGRLLIGLLVGMPVGFAVLLVASPDLFRTLVSGITLILLVFLVSGVRYRGTLGAGGIFGTGVASGLLGGVAGLFGPPVILVYMARPLSPAVIRANVLIFLMLADVSLIALYAGTGEIVGGAVVTGVLLMIPNLVGNWIGGRLFDERRERLYRLVSYSIIAASAIAGLPFLR